MGLTNRELEIKMTLQDEATKKIYNVRESFKQMGGEAKGFLSPLASIQRAVGRVGLVWGATAGVMVKAFNEASKELTFMDTTAIKLGVTTEDLSKRIYGFNLATANFRIAQGQMAALAEKTKESWTGFGKIIGDAWGEMTKLNRAILLYNQMTVGRDFSFQQRLELWNRANQISENRLLAEAGSRKSRTPAALIAEANLQGEIDKLTKSGYSLKQLQLTQQVGSLRVVGVAEQKLNEFSLAQTARLVEDKEIAYRTLASKQLEISGNTIEALKLQQLNEMVDFKRQWGDSGEMVEIFKRGQEAVLKQKKLSVLGLKNLDMIMQDNYRSQIAGMTDTMETFFDDAFHGNLQKAQNYFVLFGEAVLKTWAKTLAEMAAMQMFGGGQKKTNWWDTVMGVVGGVAGMLGGFNGASLGNTIASWFKSAPSFSSSFGGSAVDFSSFGMNGFFHKGGPVLNGLVRAHTGLAVDEVPIIAQRGEYVMSRRGVAAAGGVENLNRINQGEISPGVEGRRGGGGITVNVNFNISAIETQSGAKFIYDHKKEISAVISSELEKGRGSRNAIRTFCR